MSSQGMVRVMGTMLLDPTCTVEEPEVLPSRQPCGWIFDNFHMLGVKGVELICAMEVKDFPIRAQACASNNTGEIVRISWVRGHQQEGSSKVRGKSEVFQTPLSWQQGYKVWFGVQKVRQYKVLTRPQTGRATYFTTSDSCRQTDFDHNFNIVEKLAREHQACPTTSTVDSSVNKLHHVPKMSSLPDPRLGSLRWMVEVGGSRQLHMQRTCRCDSGKGGVVGWYIGTLHITPPFCRKQHADHAVHTSFLSTPCRTDTDQTITLDHLLITVRHKCDSNCAMENLHELLNNLIHPANSLETL
ncbi:hypothetical protein Bbelb_439600 [Branchiostoma belcheri]|nr:hypothetical protein Bbelb_439600 [Branchiostoma belcheri]